MVLKELEIQGFKSFPDKLRIPFDRGITGVVGPNGSGKSNISDAIRWVLGETSSKQLRGAGKMEDVIFGGTQLRSAMGFASVRLTLDNTDRTLDVDSDEVIIGRRYYRSGDSEYSVNGQQCRLKDIYEMFLDTGLGRDGYSIIGQGRIAEIVGAKSAERREIFEEASGIAKFRYRKNEAERRLQNAEANLERLRDIVNELQQRVEPLAKESAKAEKFLALSEQRKSVEVTLWVESIRRARETVKELQHQYDTAEADYLRFESEGGSAEAEAEQIRTEAQRLTVEIERMNTAIRTVTEEMGLLDQRTAVLENDIAHNTQSIESLQAEIAQSEQSMGAIEAEINEKEQEAAGLEARAAALTIEIDGLSDTLNRIQAESLASGERRGEVTAALAGLTEQQTASRVNAAAAASAADAAQERVDALLADRENGEAALQRMRQETADTETYLKSVTDNLARLRNIRGGLAMKLEARRKALNEADEAEQRIDREMDAAEQRLKVLRDLERGMDGYSGSVKKILQAAESRNVRGVIATIASLMEVDKGYETAIEIAMGGAMQNVVVEDSTAAKAAMQYLKRTNAGRATFLPLDIERRTVRGTLAGTAQVATDVVHVNPRYDNCLSHLLGNIIIVDDIDEAEVLSRRLDRRYKIVTLDGQVINPGGSFTGGSVSRSAGLFSRRKEIDDLKQTLLTLQKKQEQAQDATDRAKAQVDKLTAEITATDSEIIVADQDRVRAETELRRLRETLDAAQASAEQLEADLTALRTQIADSRSAAERETAEEARLTKQIDALSEELRTIAEGDDSFLTTRTRLSDELSAKRLERLEAEKSAENCRAAAESLRARTRESSDRRTDLDRSIRELQARCDEARARIANVETERAEKQAAIADAEEKIQQAGLKRMERQQAEIRANERARSAAEEKEKMHGEMTRLSERMTSAEGEYSSAVDRLWEEYTLSVTEAEKLCVPFENITALRAQVAELRGSIRALGNVNVGAIDEYKEVSARYETLSAQVNDVERSKAELEKLIRELSEQMRSIFSENFAVINENFGRIFRELFGGGSASLALEQDADILDAGIEIRVAPPGKVIKNLSALSGGEQALVAISIYFAILAVNPAPFCILDEIEAALDDANVVRYAQYLRRITDKTQFIVITHRRGTMEAADVLYGVTMQEDGVSKLIRLDLNNVDASLVTG